MTQPRSPASPGDSFPEGEEDAPRGTRAMSIVRWVLVGTMALAAAGAWIHHASPRDSGGEVGRFSCPMHPAIVSSQPGQCPICGMDLVPAASRPGTASTSADAATLSADPGPAPGPGEVELSADRLQLMGLRTAPAVREPFAPAIRTVGFVTSDEAGIVSVSARFSGWVERLAAARTGQQVEKGALLANIYAPETLGAQQVFLSALRWSDRPGTGLERDARQKLLLLGLASRDIDEIARTGQVETAVPVRAPARGFLARKGVVRGAFVQAGTELFQIVDLSTVWVLADISEDEIRRVATGQAASFEVSTWPGEPFLGKIDVVYPAVSPGSRTLQARIALPNPGLRLRPGMFGDVTLLAHPEDALVVPRDALVDTGDTQYVFVARGQGRFAPRRVRAGWSGEDKVVIREGLAEGEQVVTAAAFMLDSESRLRAALEAPAPFEPGTATGSTPARGGQTSP